MAEIPVERKTKSSFPWWLIPLLLLLLLLPLLYFTCGRNNNVVVDNTNGNRNSIVNSNLGNAGANLGNMTGNAVNAVGNTVGNAVNTVGNAVSTTNGNNTVGSANNNSASGDTVTAVNFFGFTKDKSSIVGRNVDLRSARVNRVLSDRVFTVKSENEEMFVLLDESLDATVDNKPRKQIKVGETVALKGDFRRVPDGEVQEERGRGLNQKEYAQMKGQQVYLHAQNLGGTK